MGLRASRRLSGPRTWLRAPGAGGGVLGRVVSAELRCPAHLVSPQPSRTSCGEPVQPRRARSVRRKQPGRGRKEQGQDVDSRLRVRGRLGCALGSHHSGAAQSGVGLLAQAGRGMQPRSPVSVTCRAGWSLARSVSGRRHLAPADIRARGLPRKGQLGPALAVGTEL